MSYRLSIDNGGEYIRIELHGTLTQVDIDEALKEILAIRRQHKLDRILCDQRKLRIPPNNIVVFDTAKQISSGPFTGMKLAILRETIPERHFFQTVATNRSGIVKIFDEEAEAKRWLQNVNQAHPGVTHASTQSKAPQVRPSEEY